MKLRKLLVATMATVFVWAGVNTQPAHAVTTINVTSGNETTHSYTDLSDTTSITVERGGRLIICTGQSNIAQVAADITFSSNGSGANPDIRVEPCMGADGATVKSRGGVFTGTITLQTDASMSAYGTKLNGKPQVVRNGFKLNANFVGGVVAPGLSPGILSVGDLTLDSDSSYEFELGGTVVGTEYDQIDATGTVTLGSSTLDVVLYNGFQPTNGQTFTIINNDAADAVVGTFAGLVEGASFTDEGVTYRISYVGGDGNDVVLTVGAGAPDTGFGPLQTSTLISSGVMIALALGIVLVARKYGKSVVRQ